MSGVIFDITKGLLSRSNSIRKVLARPATDIRRSPIGYKIRKRVGLLNESWSVNESSIIEAERSDHEIPQFRSMIEGNFQGSVSFICDPNDSSIKQFLESCQELNVRGVVIDAYSSEFLRSIRTAGCEIHIIKPQNTTSFEREIFRERTELLASTLQSFVYPAPLDQSFHEAKRNLANFLDVHDIPHPRTKVFFREIEAIEYLSTCPYPQVFKTSNGASGRGVEILKNKKQAISLAKTLFRSYYMNKMLSDYRDIDYGYLILQEYVHGVREHRIIKIGDSWFGHEKAATEEGGLMSGSGVNKWTAPSDYLLNFCHALAQRFKFSSMCFDIFEESDGNLLVNELQTWFGSYNPSQMYIDGIPGRYITHDDVWRFERGLFNIRGSITLRIVDAINSYIKQKEGNG